MRRIVHYECGEPAEVLRVEEIDPPKMEPDQIRVRVTKTPIHVGDLLGVMGSPAFGSPPSISVRGRVPGFEGAGIVTAAGSNVDPKLGLSPGRRVAFFPADSTWSDEVVVPASSLVQLPENVPDEIGSQALINTITALTALRAANDSLPPEGRENVVTLVTAASSAVGRLIAKILVDRGGLPIRLVRSEASARALSSTLPHSPVFATETEGWKENVRNFVGKRKIHVAIDSVGGRLLGDIGELLAEGTGTVLNFGSLGGEISDIRSFPPRSLTLKGVAMASWLKLPDHQRQADVNLALQLAGEPAGIFDVAGLYTPSRLQQALEHVGRPGRTGLAILDFS